MDKMDKDLLSNESFCCPITNEIMRDPVIDPEGNTYERSAIEGWLKQHATSPITRNPLTVSQLIPNRVLKDAIEAELVSRGLSLMSLPPPPDTSNTTMEASLPPSPPASSDPVSISMIYGNRVQRGDDSVEVDVVVSLTPQDSTTRNPIDICCVVDVSGSMGSDASIKGVESNGLSLLDIVKHALKTIINTLAPTDRLALVSFSSKADVKLELTPMTDDKKAAALRCVDSLDPTGMTNLWDGLVKGLDTLAADTKQQDSNASSNRRNTSLLLLTDGEPNVIPPRGHLPMLQRYRDAHNGEYPATIHTFGFGYSLDSVLLRELAVEGHGMYAFIPDSGFVGTVFVNALANSIATMGIHATLSLETHNGAKILPVNDAGVNVSPVSWGASCDIGSLQWGQSRDIAIRLRVPPCDEIDISRYLTPSLKYEPIGIARIVGAVTVDTHNSTSASTTALLLQLSSHLYRRDVILLIASILEQGKRNKDRVVLLKPAETPLVASLEEALTSDDLSPSKRDYIHGILKDVTGQIAESCSRLDWFQKWGCHYLPSLMRAHELQQCNNFKDPGVQGYGGSLFKSVRDHADDVFNNLPPPTPSNPVLYDGGGRGGTGYGSTGIKAKGFGGAAMKRSSAKPCSAPMPSMAMYNSACTPCFDGCCEVKMVDGSVKRVDELRKNDKVIVDGGVGVVECVVRTSSANSTIRLVTLHSGLRVTPWHPIMRNDKWVFPCEILDKSEDAFTDAVYSFLLAADPLTKCRPVSMSISGETCITLAHGIMNDVVATHAFFGTEEVVRNLQESSGWNDGLVQLKENCMIKDANTQLVKRLLV